MSVKIRTMWIVFLGYHRENFSGNRRTNKQYSVETSQQLPWQRQKLSSCPIWHFPSAVPSNNQQINQFPPDSLARSLVRSCRSCRSLYDLCIKICLFALSEPIPFDFIALSLFVHWSHWEQQRARNGINFSPRSKLKILEWNYNVCLTNRRIVGSSSLTF